MRKDSDDDGLQNLLKTLVTRLEKLESGRSNTSRDSGSRARGKCFYCDKPGHFKRDCREFKARELQALGSPSLTQSDQAAAGAGASSPGATAESVLVVGASVQLGNQ